MGATRAFVPVIRWKLRSVMADRKMSATRLAELLGVNRVTVSGWVRSDEIPEFRGTHEKINSFCFFLECTPADLIHYTPDEDIERSKESEKVEI